MMNKTLFLLLFFFCFTLTGLSAQDKEAKFEEVVMKHLKVENSKIKKKYSKKVNKKLPKYYKELDNKYREGLKVKPLPVGPGGGPINPPKPPCPKGNCYPIKLLTEGISLKSFFEAYKKIDIRIKDAKGGECKFSLTADDSRIMPEEFKACGNGDMEMQIEFDSGDPKGNPSPVHLRFYE